MSMRRLDHIFLHLLYNAVAFEGFLTRVNLFTKSLTLGSIQNN